MNEMAKQMELFDEGGLMQEGGTVDPVSGNDVPVGSTQEEVRDDIPAQLSEGEFVMPADVVRYHGLDKMMALRDEAKMGLQRMEAMGQMGNSEEATIPDGVPFDMEDLEMEDDGLEMAQGGLVNMANGGAMPGSNLISGPLTTGFPVSGYNPMQNAPNYQQFLNSPQYAALSNQLGPQVTAPVQVGGQTYTFATPGAANAYKQFMGITGSSSIPSSLLPTTGQPPKGQAAAPMQAASTAPVGQAAAPMQAASAQFQQLGGTKFTPTTQTTTTTPTFQETIGMGVPYVDYDPNAPDGTEQPETPAEKVEPPKMQPTSDTGDGGDFDPRSGSTGTTSAGSLSELVGNLTGFLKGSDEDIPRGKSVGDIFVSAANKDPSQFTYGNPNLRKATLAQAGYQLGTIGFAGMATKLAQGVGLIDFSLGDISNAGAYGMNQALNSMGLTNNGQLMNDAQAKLVASAMVAGHGAAQKGGDVKAAINEILNSEDAKKTQDKAYQAIKTAYAEKAGVKDIDNFTDADFAKEMQNKVKRSDIILGDIETGSITDSRGKTKGTKLMSRDFSKPKVNGKYQMKPTNVYTGLGKTLKNNATAQKKQAMTLLNKATTKERDRYKSEFDVDKDDGGYNPGDTFTGGAGLNEGQVSESVFSDTSSDTGTNFGDDYNQPEDKGTDFGDSYNTPTVFTDVPTYGQTTVGNDMFEGSGNTSSSDPCFITTAIVEKKGEADDGETLTKLRKFRNEYMADKQEEVQEYYEIAPKIVEAIDDEEEWKWIEEQIQKAVDYIDEEKHDDAYTTYKSMVSTLKEKWLV